MNLKALSSFEGIQVELGQNASGEVETRGTAPGGPDISVTSEAKNE